MLTKLVNKLANILFGPCESYRCHHEWYSIDDDGNEQHHVHTQTACEGVCPYCVDEEHNDRNN